MRILALDFETYYDKDVSLKKLNTMEYVNNPKFKVMGCAAYFLDERTPEQIALMKLMDVQPDWYNEEEVEEFLRSIDWDNTAVLCHHVNFDAYILAQVYGIKPAFHYDTMAMSRGRFPSQSASLGALAERLFPDDTSIRKGTELASAKGIDTYSPELDRIIGAYACNDIYVMVAAFKELMPTYPTAELQIIDIVTRMFTQSRFVLDRKATTAHRNDARDGAAAKVASSGVSKELLGSNDQFAAYVRDTLKLEVPMKQGKNKSIPAFGKNDIAFQKLKAAHPEFNHIWEARAATKSRIDETRATRFLDGTNRDGTIPMPINYYAAHTGRFGGGEKLNPQNLKRGSNLRKALQAPEGYVVVVADKSQIEARLVAWLAGCDELTQAFRDGRDVYSEFSTVIYNRPIAKSDTIERFVGKTCLSGETLVYTQLGLVRIDSIRPDHQVWDGDNWVCQQGKLYQGYKPTVKLCGISLTPDHKVWSGTQWQEAQSLLSDNATLHQALEHAAANSPSLDTYVDPKGGSPHLLYNATAPLKNTQSIPTPSKTSDLQDALTAAAQQEEQNVSGSMRKQCPTTAIVPDYSTDSLRRWDGVITLKIKPMNIMERAVSVLRYRGAMIGRNFSGMFRQLKDGTTHHLKWTAPTTTKDTNPETSGLFRVKTTWKTEEPSANSNAESLSSRHVWDIANAGPNHRFTIHTERGPLIVSNCILGLGFGVGGVKLQVTLESGSQGPVVIITEVESRRIVSKYRTKYHQIPDLWKKLEQVQVWIQNPSYYGNQYGPMKAVKEGWMMPNGMVLQYPQASGLSFYDHRFKKHKKIWGGVLCENWIQSLARVDICTNMCAMDDYFREHPEVDGYVALQIHDEIICICREEYGQRVYDKMYQVMTTPPHWAPDIPLKAEGGFAKEYSK